MTPVSASYSIIMVKKPYRSPHIESAFHRIEPIRGSRQSEAIGSGTAGDKGPEETTAISTLRHGFHSASHGIEERNASAVPCFGALDVVMEYVVFDVAGDFVIRYGRHRAGL